MYEQCVFIHYIIFKKNTWGLYSVNHEVASNAYRSTCKRKRCFIPVVCLLVWLTRIIPQTLAWWQCFLRLLQMQYLSSQASEQHVALKATWAESHAIQLWQATSYILSVRLIRKYSSHLDTTEHLSYCPSTRVLLAKLWERETKLWIHSAEIREWWELKKQHVVKEGWLTTMRRD